MGRLLITTSYTSDSSAGERKGGDEKGSNGLVLTTCTSNFSVGGEGNEGTDGQNGDNGDLRFDFVL